MTFVDGAQAYLPRRAIGHSPDQREWPDGRAGTASMALLATGLIGVGMVHRRKQNAA